MFGRSRRIRETAHERFIREHEKSEESRRRRRPCAVGREGFASLGHVTEWCHVTNAWIDSYCRWRERAAAQKYEGGSGARGLRIRGRRSAWSTRHGNLLSVRWQAEAFVLL